MKIAIQNNQSKFTKEWIVYCKDKNIPFKLVNSYDTNIIEQLNDCDAFLWHFHHNNYKDSLFAKQLLFSLQQSGKKVFPNFNTCWHFDDKVGEKYLLESINAPLVKTYVFYSKDEALTWARNTNFPKVFKLRGGAGASNVILIKNIEQAYKVINKAFTKGFTAYNGKSERKEALRKLRLKKISLLVYIKIILSTFFPSYSKRMLPTQKGYVYFQDFISDNTTDFRIKVVNGRCWGFQRSVRQNDFRASGSGNLIFDNTKIPLEMIEIAMKISRILSLQSVAFDFVIDHKSNKPLIIETSYCFGFDEKETENGYWDSNLVWHSEKFNPFDWMIECIINK